MTTATPNAKRAAARALNANCQCVSTGLTELAAAMNTAAPDAIWTARPHLVSPAVAFLASEDFAAMIATIGAVETTTRLPAFAQAIAARTPAAMHNDQTRGVMMGYDFHLSSDGPRLIEINTNAGGAFICAEIARVTPACCDATAAPLSPIEFAPRAIEMFRQEFAHQFGDKPLRTIAIVDDAPERQYLYPEFLLAQRLFEAAGVRTIIADASAISYREGALTISGVTIDLVYNRLTDFALEAPEHEALRRAWIEDAATVTPSPRHHALFADKRNLTIFADALLLAEMGLPAKERTALSTMLDAIIVDGGNADALWADRRNWFFKPFAGHASKAVWRGDKMTRSVFADVRRGGYIAQRLAPATERFAHVDGVERTLKTDFRIYAYDGEPLLATARLYQGQTTNFRTPGGGFAPVLLI